MRPELLRFAFCPLASRFIETRDDALSYYAHRLVGEHRLVSRGKAIVVVFNAEETHVFTDERTPCPPGDVVRRAGASRELRCFSLKRARLLDEILRVIVAPVVCHVARTGRGAKLFGPADAEAERLCVVVGHSAGEEHVYYVRTAFPVTGKGFTDACRSARPSRWP